MPKDTVEGYAEIFARASGGETLVLLFALDHWDRKVPRSHLDLLPRPWSEIESKLRKGETVTARGRARGFPTVLLAAPTLRELERLIAEAEL